MPMYPDGFTFEEWCGLSPDTSSRTAEQNRITFKVDLDRGWIIKIGDNLYDLPPDFKPQGGRSELDKGYGRRKGGLSLGGRMSGPSRGSRYGL